ncbi:hypothetical protein DPMN_168292 [Dreissena polymorpha]|uniref:Uncharacterized protein n=1 Tax=Dreissena polymorpha TaxID=45954 RepID=A0A9D4F660_DREPO|nr:hypothetical protein DPMN_168292 [Dreissena polymorpha]
MSNGALSPATHGGSPSVSGRNGNEKEVTVSGPVPESLRRTRKFYIFVDTASPVKPVEIKRENAYSSGNNDADKSAHFSKQLTLNIPKNNNTGISNSTNTSQRSKLSPTRTMSPKSPNSNLTSSPASSGKGNFIFVKGGSWATKTTTYLQLPSQASAGAHTEQGQS